jgi:septal ring factor EnvC (AmiA/AmiB activator)
VATARPGRCRPGRFCRPVGEGITIRSGTAVAHRCLNEVEAALQNSHKDPAVTHRCLNNAETTLENSHKDPAVTHRRLNNTETTLQNSHKDPAVTHRRLNNTETTLQNSHEDPAVAHRCLNGVETAVENSRTRMAHHGQAGGGRRRPRWPRVRVGPSVAALREARADGGVQDAGCGQAVREAGGVEVQAAG